MSIMQRVGISLRFLGHSTPRRRRVVVHALHKPNRAGIPIEK